MDRVNKLRPKSRREDRLNLFVFGPGLVSDKNKYSWGNIQTESVNCIKCEVDDPNGKYLLKAVYEFTVTKEMLNPRGTLHGGFQTTLFDNLSTFCAAGFDHFWENYDEDNMKIFEEGMEIINAISKTFGVSRQLSATYLRALNLGEKATLEIEIISETKTFVVLMGKAYDSKGRLCTTFFHDKVKIGPRL